MSESVEFTRRQKVEHKLKGVKELRRFFGEKNPNADFAYADAVLADAERFLRKLPDRPDIVYKPVWERLFGAEAALHDAVRDDLKRKFKENCALRRDLPSEFATSVLEVCDKVFTKNKKTGRNLFLDFIHALGNSKKLFSLCTGFDLKVPDSIYNDVAKYGRRLSEDGTTEEPLPPGRILVNESDLRIVGPTARRRPVREVDVEIKDLGNDAKRAGDIEELGHIAESLVKVHLETIELRMELGQNKQTYDPQWESRVGDILYVLDRISQEPPEENILALYEIIHKGPRTVVVRFIRPLEEVKASVSTEQQTAPLRMLIPPTREKKHPEPKKEKRPTGMFVISGETPTMDPEEARAKLDRAKNVLLSLGELPQPKAAASKKKAAEKGKKEGKKQARKRRVQEAAA